MSDPYAPPPESQGGWRMLVADDELHDVGGMDPQRLVELAAWLRSSDERDFAAVVIRHGHIVLQVERHRSAATDTGNVKSCAKAILATVLAIAAQESADGLLPIRFNFESKAFDLLPLAHPLSDARKREITVRQLLNHTSGITPESSGVPNAGPWEMILGHGADPRTQRLYFDPGSDLDYGTHALYHAALLCEQVTGQPYDRYAVARLFRPLGIEHWWFEIIGGDERHGAHASHSLGMSARAMARIVYCMLQRGRWGDHQVIPEWFVDTTARPTHHITGIKTFGDDAEYWTDGWELLARLSDGRGEGIPADTRSKAGSGGQMIGFIPSLDLVFARQTGSSGAWPYDEFARRAVAAVRQISDR